MSRTRQQLEAVAEFTDKELVKVRKFQALPEDAVGMDGIRKDSCYTNGHDTAKELGITRENGFADLEIETAMLRYAASTACSFDLI